MKTARTIINHITSLPQFKLLKRQKCYEKYKNLLKNKWKNIIAFIYIKDNTLFIAITHPGFKMELNYNKNLLKSLLRQLHRYDDNCKMLQADNIIVFHSKFYIMPEEKALYKSVPHYHELSLGDFEVPKDKILKEHFERIKKIITDDRSF